MSSTPQPPRSPQPHSAPGTPSPLASRAKLQKTPHILNRRAADDDDEDEPEEDKPEHEKEEEEEEGVRPGSPSILLASALGLNHIRTRYSSSPLRYSSSLAAPPIFPKDANVAKPRSKPSHSKDLGPHFSLFFHF